MRSLEIAWKEILQAAISHVTCRRGVSLNKQRSRVQDPNSTYFKISTHGSLAIYAETSFSQIPKRRDVSHVSCAHIMVTRSMMYGPPLTFHTQGMWQNGSKIDLLCRMRNPTTNQIMRKIDAPISSCMTRAVSRCVGIKGPNFASAQPTHCQRRQSV
jgi:hypothetical protein